MAKQVKRHFLQQAMNHVDGKHPVVGQFMSEKLDGMRTFWDGGITRGVDVAEIPWANTAKDTKTIYSTGLWSRYGKTIQAPDWWLDSLPFYPLDGELHAGRGNFQQTMSYARKHIPVDNEWKLLVFNVFDSPSLSQVLYNSHIKQGSFNQELTGCQEFCSELTSWNHLPINSTYDYVYDFLRHNLPATEPNLKLVSQSYVTSLAHFDDFVKRIAQLGGEGVILRDPLAIYAPVRSHSITKIKPFFDDEATVVGYITGRQTDRGSKLLGMMGALILDYKGQRLELSGFTDAERQLVNVPSRKWDAHIWATNHPETECPDWITSSYFPRGSAITFRYRELSNSMIPKEARYHRPYSEA
jgi:DNA ligase-1